MYWLLVQIMRVALWVARRECPDCPRNLLADAMGDAGWYARSVQPLPVPPEQIERELDEMLANLDNDAYW